MVEMARLRTAERIREGAAEGIAKNLEDSLAWKVERNESGCTKGNADFGGFLFAKIRWGIGNFSQKPKLKNLLASKAHAYETHAP
jgi:hypothetical protein